MKEFESTDIVTARLSKLPPESAAEALCEYNQKQKDNIWFDRQSPVETVLLARREPLIDLALAQYGVNDEVLKELYQRSLSGTGDADFDKGIRVAVLANRLSPSRFWEVNPAINLDDVARIAVEGSDEEIKALLTNPMTRDYVEKLYRREPPFSSISDDRLNALVRASIHNPRLTFDDHTDEDPDLIHLGIARGISEMLATAPVTLSWLWAMDELLFNFMTEHLYREKDVLQIIDRWRTVDLKALNSQEMRSGHYTELTMSEEFCCRVAAMLGALYENGTEQIIGKPDSQDVVLRSAYYGNSPMKPDEMRAAYEKDGSSFTYAALHNHHFYWNRACRVALESMLRGYQIDLYTEVCRRLAEENKRFDPKPIGDDFEIEEIPPDDPIAGVLTSIKQLEERLSLIQKDASTAKGVGFGILIILIVALLMK